MEKRNIITFAIIGIVVIGAVAIAAILRQPEGSMASPSGSTLGESSSPTNPHSTTWAPVPTSVVAPNEGSANPAANVAIPSEQVAASPESTASFRTFNLEIKNNAYVPNMVIVNQGDTVNLNVTAVDGSYGFTQPDYGLNAVIKEGRTQQIQFQALQSGKFTFYCGSCGGPSKGPVGYLMVTTQ